MTLLEIILATVLAIAVVIAWRRGRKAPSPALARSGEWLPQSTPSKLDPRLHTLLNLPPAELRRLKRDEDEAYRELVRACEAMRAEAAAAEGDKANELAVEIGRRVAALPIPLTFGLYFPDDEPTDVSRLTYLKEPFVSTTISSEAGVQDLQTLGVHVRNQAGNIFTVYVPLSILAALQQSSAIDYVELARPWRPQLDVAIPQTQIDVLHSPGAITGKDVIVGVVDVGPLDFYHPAFRRTDDTAGQGALGSTRILYLWDQTLLPDASKGEKSPPSAASVPPLPGFSPAGGSYGTEYSAVDINQDLQNFPPPYITVRSPRTGEFHGNLVTSCAAGNLRSPVYPYIGGAPEADIIYVQTTNGNNYVFADSTNILDGTAYIFARAALAGKPCVVNISGSDNLGAHDGNLHGEQFLDNLLLEPGRAITCSAGNVNIFGLHAKGSVIHGGTTPIVMLCRSAPFPPATRSETIQVWYDGHDRFTISLTIPTATPTVVGPVAAGAFAVQTLAGGITVRIDSMLDNPRNHDNWIEIRITGVTAAHPIPVGQWKLSLDGVLVINGAFDVWIDRNNNGSVVWQAPTLNEGTIGSPATARRPISVGAHNGAGSPTIWPMSGCGPTRDGRVKPEIAAPGQQIEGATSRDMNASSPGPLDGPMGGASGTSYATAIVSGAAALLFQCRGKGLTCGDIKQVLTDLAGAPAVPSNGFGFGFLQMTGACAGPTPAVDVWLRDSVADVGVEPYTGGVAWLSPDIEVRDAAGQPVANPTHETSNLWNNQIAVTVRNRGAQTARNIEVFLYWADPATNIPFPTEWKSSGIYIGEPAFVEQGNRTVVGQLLSGASRTVVFAWAPPAPGSNIRGDDHFCLIVRIEHEADPANVNTGGWPVVAGSNNIALRNLHVQSASAAGASTAFFVNGTGEGDALELTCQDVEADCEVILPTRALAWRELAILERCHGRRPVYGERGRYDAAEHVRRVFDAREVTRILGITGAERAHVEGAATRLLVPLDGRRLVISEARLLRGIKMPVRLLVRRPRLKQGIGWVHVTQRGGGKSTGGVSLEIRERLAEMTRYDVRRRADTTEVTRRRLA